MNDNSNIENKIENTMSGWEVKFSKSKQDAWSEITQRVDNAKIIPMKKAFNWRSWAVAASVALMLGWAVFANLGSDMTEVYAANVMEVKLPDASVVTLNEGATLRYDEDNWTQKREVFLEGEGFFEVAKGSKFTTVSKSGSVKVYGTAFNVYDMNDEYVVSCDHGKVGVNVGDQEIILTANEYTALDHGQLQVPLTTQNANAWIDGSFLFENAPLQLVMDELERRYNVNITLGDEGMNGRQFSGSFKVQSLDQTLSVISLTLGITYEINGKEVIIKNK